MLREAVTQKYVLHCGVGGTQLTLVLQWDTVTYVFVSALLHLGQNTRAIGRGH